MSQRRTYRVPKETAPRLLYELSRIGTRVDSSTQTTAIFRAPRGFLELRTSRERRVLGTREGLAERTVDIGSGPIEEVLELAGLPREVTYVSERERYHCPDAFVSLDHVIPLGWFCVITADRVGDIEALSTRLGLDPASIELRDYADLFRERARGEPTVMPPVAAPEAPPATVADRVRAPERELQSAPPPPQARETRPSGSGGRILRVALAILTGGALAVILDTSIGLLAGAALLLLEWGFGGARQTVAKR